MCFISKAFVGGCTMTHWRQSGLLVPCLWALFTLCSWHTLRHSPAQGRLVTPSSEKKKDDIHQLSNQQIWTWSLSLTLESFHVLECGGRRKQGPYFQGVPGCTLCKGQARDQTAVDGGAGPQTCLLTPILCSFLCIERVASCGSGFDLQSGDNNK